MPHPPPQAASVAVVRRRQSCDVGAARPPASRMDDAGNTIAQRSMAPVDRGNVRGGGDDAVAIADKPPEIPPPGEMITVAQSTFGETSFIDGSPVDRSAQIYFGGSIMGPHTGLQSWAPGAEPILVSPSDSGIKLSSLEGTDNDDYGGDETITGKDESRVLSPAQRLGPCRQAARRGAEVPRRRGLFRGARRSDEGPGSRRPGGR